MVNEYNKKSGIEKKEGVAGTSKHFNLERVMAVSAKVSKEIFDSYKRKERDYSDEKKN